MLRDFKGRRKSHRSNLCRDLLKKLGRGWKDDIILFVLQEDHSGYRTEYDLGATEYAGLQVAGVVQPSCPEKIRPHVSDFADRFDPGFLLPALRISRPGFVS